MRLLRFLSFFLSVSFILAFFMLAADGDDWHFYVSNFGKHTLESFVRISSNERKRIEPDDSEISMGDAKSQENDNA